MHVLSKDLHPESYGLSQLLQVLICSSHVLSTLKQSCVDVNSWTKMVLPQQLQFI